MPSQSPSGERFRNAVRAGLILSILVLSASADRIILQQQLEVLSGEEDVEDLGADESISRAALPGDDKIDEMLKKTEEYVRTGRIDLAVIVWQKILDGNPGVLRKRPPAARGQTSSYVSVQVEVEDMLLELAIKSPEGLREYRLKSDPEARGLMAQAKGQAEEKFLSETVRRFFFSSLGDEASYRLGCLMLDRHEFVAAARLFLDMLERHPDFGEKPLDPPAASVREVLLRLAVAAARSGDKVTAQAAAQLHKQVSGAAVPADVQRWMTNLAKGGQLIDAGANLPAGSWPMAYGTPRRDGRMPGLPADVKYAGVWRETWMYAFGEDGFGLPAGAAGTTPAAMQPRFARGVPQPAINPDNDPTGRARRFDLRNRWQANDWTPTDTLIMHEDRIFVRAMDRVVCLEARTGRVLINSKRRVMPQITPISPSTSEQVFFFADRASTSMSLHDDVLYYLEDDTTASMPNSGVPFRNRSGTIAQRPQWGNQMVAMDAITGDILWSRGSEPDESGARHGVRYKAAPIKYGNLLLAPAMTNGDLWLYARRADRKGELAWKVFLADEPRGGSSPWASTGLAVAGGDAYLAFGGWVFNVDANNGVVRWAKPYEQSVSNVRMNQYGGPAQSMPAGWDDDFVMPYGGTLLVAPHDGGALFTLERRTGDRRKTDWSASRGDATHVLGLSGGTIYVAGRHSVAAYDVATGKLASSPRSGIGTDQGGITGRGFVAEDAVYLPMRTALLRLHPKNLHRELSVVEVVMQSKDANDEDYTDLLGNLYCDGQQIFGVGLGRVYAVGERSKRGAAGIDGGDFGVRPGIEANTGDPLQDLLLRHGIRPTAEDIGQYFRKLQPSPEALKQIDELIAKLGHEDYGIRQQAQDALRRMPVPPTQKLIEARDNGNSPEIRDRARRIIASTDSRRVQVLKAALQMVEKKKITGLTGQLLAVLPLCTERSLLDSAGRALAATVTEADAPLLRKTLSDSAAAAAHRAAAAWAMSVSLSAEAKADLTALWNEKDDQLRLAAARGLARYGDRDSLAMLVDLLDSEDVQIRSRANLVLQALTKQNFRYVAYVPPADRKAAADAWRKWVTENGKTAKLVTPLNEGSVRLGRTLIANYRTRRVYELDESGSEIFSVENVSSYGIAGLPNGHRLIANYSGRQVTEYDDAGKVVREQGNLPGGPHGVQRLENGRTLIALATVHRVVELDENGTIAWNAMIQGRPVDARRLPDGRTLVALQSAGQVVELDEKGNATDFKIQGLNTPNCVQRLADGHTLVVEMGANRVREFDEAGKQVAEITHAGNVALLRPGHAERLDNGNTIIADQNGVREIDPSGKVVWEKLEQGAMRVVRY